MDNLSIQGTFLDGQKSGGERARLLISDQHPPAITLYVNDACIKSLNTRDIRIHSRIGNAPREVYLPEEGLFVSDDHASIDALSKLLKKGVFTGVLHTLETHFFLVVFSVIFCVTALYACMTIGVPAAAKTIAYALPDDIQQHFDSSLLVLDKAFFKPSELPEEKQRYIKALVEPYLLAHQDKSPSIQFRTGVGANAFALPSGEIVFTDEFVELTETDEQLLAVFFHELGHLEHKHILRRTIQDIMFTFIIISLTGDLDTIDLVTGLPTLLFDLAYSREFEREADDYALRLLVDHGIDPQHFADIMLRLQASVNTDKADENDESTAERNERIDKVVEFLSTHPATDERINTILNYTK